MERIKLPVLKTLYRVFGSGEIVTYKITRESDDNMWYVGGCNSKTGKEFELRMRHRRYGSFFDTREEAVKDALEKATALAEELRTNLAETEATIAALTKELS